MSIHAAPTPRETWRPSNGTEGEIFADNRCNRCVNDRWDDATATGESCPIWLTLLIGEDDPHVYWDDDAKHGECDMFHDKHAERRDTLTDAKAAVIDARPWEIPGFAARVFIDDEACGRALAVAAIDQLLEETP